MDKVLALVDILSGEPIMNIFEDLRDYGFYFMKQCLCYSCLHNMNHIIYL